MNKATCDEVALWVMSGYPDHGVDADDPGLGMLALFGHQLSRIEQDGVERTMCLA